MKTVRGLLIGLSLAVCSFAGPGDTNLTRVTSFSDLPMGNTIEIQYEWHGCFDYRRSVFSFSPAGNGEFEVYEIVPEPRRDDNAETKWSKRRLGTIRLERGETQKLDALLSLYRDPGAPKALLMMGNTIMLSLPQYRGKRIVAQESFIWDDTRPIPYAEPPRPFRLNSSSQPSRAKNHVSGAFRSGSA